MEEVRVDIVADTGAGTESSTLLQLRWRPVDPLAVALTVRRLPQHPSLVQGEWLMLRDFLRYGLEAATGDGDVRLRPGTEANVVIDLSGKRGQCSLSVPAAAVREFLVATERVVPCGAERSDEAIDHLIEQLLGREP